MTKKPRQPDDARRARPGRGSRSDSSPAIAAAVRGGGFRRWYHANRTDLRFLLIFAVCMLLYYVATLTQPVKNGFFPAYLRFNAQASGTILGWFGQDVRVEDQTLSSPGGPSIGIERGCDAVEPSALFVSAVLASPVPIVAKLGAAAAGSLLLMVLNLIRVMSLFLVRVYYPRAFETMHLDVWQVLFILLAIVMWAMWASRMARKRSAKDHGAT